LSITRGNASETSAGLFNRNFTFQFTLDAASGLDVADES
jgi:hypothetical protein